MAEKANATILELMEIANKNAKSKGWWNDESKTFADVAALLHSEISEAFEEYRNGHGVREIYWNGSKPEGIPIELADELIRIFDVCKQWKIPIVEALRVKMNYNQTRPYRHGGKKL